MDIREWYYPEHRLPPAVIAENAYNEAKTEFASALSQDTSKLAIIESENDIETLLGAIEVRKQQYEAARTSNKARQWLTAMSSRITFYGGVMDVLMQQSPMWASFAWGAMKMIFVAVENHEHLLSTFASAVCRLGVSLPRLERSMILFPTPEIISGTAKLYAQIMRFLTRALKWYSGHKLSHVKTAFFKPKEILLDDILEEIHLQTSELTQWINHSSHAEQRDMHREQQDLILRHGELSKDNKQTLSVVEEILRMVTTIPNGLAELRNGQARIEAHVLDTNDRVYDVQLSSMLEACRRAHELDCMEVLHRALILRARRIRSGQYVGLADNLGPRLHSFANRPDASIMVVKGSVSDRHAIGDASSGIVELLQSSRLPVLWVLNHSPFSSTTWSTPSDLLRALCLQALQANNHLHDEKSVGLKASQMRSAQHTKDWLLILASILSTMGTVWLVLDLTAEAQAMAEILTQQRLVWCQVFEELIALLKARGHTGALKVVLLSDNTMDCVGSPSDPTLSVFVPRQARRSGKRRRGPNILGRPLKFQRQA